MSVCAYVCVRLGTTRWLWRSARVLRQVDAQTGFSHRASRSIVRFPPTLTHSLFARVCFECFLRVYRALSSVIYYWIYICICNACHANIKCFFDTDFEIESDH